MATQRYVSTSFWDDEWIQGLDPSEKLLYLYLMTNPLTNIAGVYKTTIRRISFDTGFNNDTIKHIFSKFEKAGKAFRFKEYVILPSWPAHQKWEDRSKINTGIVNILKSLDNELLEFIKSVGYRYPIDTISIPHPYPPNYPDSDVETDSDTEIDNDTNADSDGADASKKNRRFKKPTIEEIEAYCKERNNNIDPKHFYSYYEARGWLLGKTKMKSWKATVHTWEQRDYKKESSSSATKDYYEGLRPL